MSKSRIYLCLAHMSGQEQKYIQEAFDTNWVVPLGPNVNGFEHDLKQFVEGHYGRDEAAEAAVSPAATEASVPAAAAESAGSGVSPAAVLRGVELAAGSGVPSAAESGLPLNRISREVVALSAGTAAVHLALIGCGVGPGDEVCVQSFTFCASSHPVTYLGATPVFIDSEKETWNMDPELLEEAIKDRIAKTGRAPKAIIPVALYGMPYRADRIMEVAERYGIPVIEDAAEGFGSRFDGQVLGTFGRFGVLSFNGNKMITTSGGGALICREPSDRDKIMWLATQAREAYPYYQHESIGYNYRLSNICAGIGRGQMTVAQAHIDHHKQVQALYEELLADVEGITVHRQPAELGADGQPRFDSNFWLCTVTLDPSLRVKGQSEAYGAAVTSAVGGAAGVVHGGGSVHTDCEPDANVEALRVALDAAGVEARPVWKPMHRQPVYKDAPAYVTGVSEEIFRRGMCLPAGPMVSADDVRYIVSVIRESLA